MERDKLIKKHIDSARRQVDADRRGRISAVAVGILLAIVSAGVSLAARPRGFGGAPATSGSTPAAYVGSSPIVVIGGGSDGGIIASTTASATTSGYLLNSAGWLVVDAGIAITGGTGIVVPNSRSGVQFIGTTNNSICFNASCTAELWYQSAGGGSLTLDATVGRFEAKKITPAATASGTAYASLTGAYTCFNTGEGSCFRAPLNDGDLVYSGGKVSFPGIALGTSNTLGNLALSATAPTVSSGFGSSPAIGTGSTAFSFTITIGTGGTASTGVITMPAATNKWNCHANDLTAAVSLAETRQSAGTTTTVTLSNINTATGVALAWTAGDLVDVICAAH